MNIFIQKTPIVDEKINLIGYEINFRGIENSFGLLDDSFTKEIIELLETIGVDKLGDKKIFINFNQKMLFEDAFINSLPKEKIVIDLNNINLTKDVIEKCKTLKSSEFLISINSVEEEAISIANFIKVEPDKVDKATISKLQKPSRKLIAKGTNTKPNYKKFKELGFKFFEGYFFLEPTIDENRKMKPDEISLFKILSLINQNAEVEEIVDIFKKAPTLSFQLLSVLNSPLLSLRKEITSIKHAIVLLGIASLKKWIMFLTFLEGTSEGSAEKFEESILSREALKRAKYLENLAKNSESGFMVGLLSLMDVALSTSKEEIFKQITLPDDIKFAILRENGELGELLKLIKLLEIEKFEEFKTLAEKLGIDLNEFNEINKKVVVE